MGAKLQQWDEPPWLRESLRSEFEPGESIHALANFSTTTTNGRGEKETIVRLFVLTDRYLRSIGFKASVAAVIGVPSKKPRKVVFSYALPLHQITSIGDARQGGMLAAEARTMSFTGPTGPESWRTTTVQGSHLVDLLKARVSTGAPKPIGVADELSKLAALRDEGVLNDDEFQRSKALFVGSTPDQQSEALDLLRQLHSLQRSGVLSEMEFNMKKWDVLSRSGRSS